MTQRLNENVVEIPTILLFVRPNSNINVAATAIAALHNRRHNTGIAIVSAFCIPHHFIHFSVS